MADTLLRPSSLPGNILLEPAPNETGGSQVSITSLLLALLVTYFLASRYKTWRRLSAFPGPRFASVSYWPMFILRRSGRAHLAYASLSHRYGALARIGPNDLISSDPAHLRRMSAARSTYERSSWYQATRLDPYHDMMGSVMDKSAHMTLRAKLAAGYTGRDNPNLESEMDAQVQSLVRLIQRKYVSDTNPPRALSSSSLEQNVKPVDFGRLADFYAHDSKATLAFGKPLGMLERDQDVHGIITIVKLALEWIQVFTDIPPLQKIFLSNTVLKLLGPKPTDSFGVGKLMGMARDYVAARFSPGAEDRQDLLGSFLRHGLDRRSAESEVMFPIIAGSDTTATAIKMTVIAIASCPRVAAKLNSEIHKATSAGRLSSPATHAEASQLPYLQAVVWEGLRFHPPFGGLMMKEVGPDGDVWNGKLIPPGTRVGHSTWAAMRDTAMFGLDVDDFRPERWLEAGDKRRAGMQRQTELVFGSGRWSCPGRAVGLMEVNRVVVELYRRFDFQVISETPQCTQKVRKGRPALSSSANVPLIVISKT